MNENLKEDIENQLECVICKEKKVKMDHFPFCSSECKLVDLYNWLSEEYVVTEKL